MELKAIRIIAASVIVTMLASGCATSGQPLTGNQQAARCALLLIGGALVAKVTGGKVGAGLAVGAAACGVLVAFNESEKKRVRAAQVKAAATGKPLEQRWTDEKKVEKSLKVSASKAQKVQTTSASLLCRTVETTVTAGARSEGMSEQWCRSPDGTYKPRSEFAAA